MASCRVFGVSDLGSFPRLNDQDQPSDLEAESSSLADLFKLDKSELFYYNKETRSGDVGGNTRRCRRYRRTRKNIVEQETNEVLALKERNISLRKLQMDLARSLEMTRELYLKCILSGKMSFSRG